MRSTLRYGYLGMILLAVFLILFGLSLLGVDIAAHRSSWAFARGRRSPDPVQPLVTPQRAPYIVETASDLEAVLLRLTLR